MQAQASIDSGKNVNNDFNGPHIPDAGWKF